MEWYWSLALLLGGLVFLMLLGMPVVFAFFGTNIVAAIFFLGGEAGLMQLVRNSVDAVKQFPLIPIPLFVLMGEVMFFTGLAATAIDAIDRLIRRVPGRLSLVAIVGGTIFSSLSGSSIANTAMLGSTLLPEMYRRGYKPTIAIGPIVAVGGIAVLIPPSSLAVLLGSLAKISVADLLVASIVPGVLMALLFFAYVIIRCLVNPSLAPAYEVPRRSFLQTIGPFVVHVLPLFAIFVVVVGSMLEGIATPTEAAALGAVASIVAAAAYGKLRWSNLLKSVKETLRVTVMTLFIICGSVTFSQVLAFSGATQGLSTTVLGLNLTPMAVILGMLLLLIFLGCFMDQVSMMMITLPLFMPVAQHLHFDLVWFGTLILLVLEISLLTPPFGILLFVAQGAAPRGTTMSQIIGSAMPFVALEFLVLGLMIWVPGLTLWLPSLMAR
ncbi:MAG: TRAP transporter large permease subunit [Rhodospirillaceae bacterium]|nr:TRAP transporter large permease subunit [Rhodospirillaceae bacterium]